MSESDVFEIDDAETLEMLADPTRIEIIERLDEAASVTELAEQMGVPRTRLYHHMRLLEDSGLIKVVARRGRRAMTEKVYRRTAEVFQPSRSFLAEASPRDAVAAIVDSMFAVTRADIARAFADGLADFGGGEDRPTTKVSRSVVTLTRQRERQFVAELEALLDKYDTSDPGGEPYAVVTMVYPSSRRRP